MDSQCIRRKDDDFFFLSSAGDNITSTSRNFPET